MPPSGGGKASVYGKQDSIRAKSGTKRRFNAGAGAGPATTAAKPFGGPSSSGSLASSLASLFQPSPHGKDAALASLLASSSKPSLDLTARQPRAKDQGLGLGALEAAPPSARDAAAQRAKAKTQATHPAAGADLTASAAQQVKRSGSTQQQQHAPKPAPISSKSVAGEPGPSNTAAVAPSAPSAASAPSVSHATALNLLQASSASPSPRGTPQPQQQPASSGSSRPASLGSSAAPSRLSTPQLAPPPLPAGRKPVFRPVLNSPLMVNWPELPQAASQTILHTLLDLLGHPEVQPHLAASFGGCRNKDKGKEKSKAKARSKDKAADASAVAERQPKRRRTAAVGHEDADAGAGAGALQKQRPWFLAGLNSTTRALERSVQESVVSSSAKGDETQTDPTATAVVAAAAGPTTITHVFVCRHDISPPTLVAHYPMLACTVNAICHSMTPSEGLHLVPLPLSSTSMLAEAVGLHSLTILALTSHIPAHLLEALDRSISAASSTSPPRSETVLRRDWMESAVHAARSVGGSKAFPLVPVPQPTAGVQVAPTSIKLLRTTQPVDLNACRVEKRRKRTERSLAARRKRELEYVARKSSLLSRLGGGSKQRKQRRHPADPFVIPTGAKSGLGLNSRPIKPFRTNSRARKSVLAPSESGLSDKARRNQRRRIKVKARSAAINDASAAAATQAPAAR
ncbi:uncharacterized protein PFL1_04994 [Pseudozyma flocculosa PF-1]|uniref:Uncharacterized protein n=2 Tax=Pseudozyma flocculosa TaxID=84751 RepID=A0A5C3EWH1_9BASI|nr:uncharacterized protein PFL1_04994 [Pseudozyma flocculosa PF-1]EPQ27456.1 hypothetical protein PFL1_04994 [Pseudozyma flocculosa PF-1]SPO36115.1 uncharacterized protein PSFLO_01586 [Pseudozyma flocculosa]